MAPGPTASGIPPLPGLSADGAARKLLKRASFSNKTLSQLSQLGSRQYSSLPDLTAAAPAASAQHESSPLLDMDDPPLSPRAQPSQLLGAYLPSPGREAADGHGAHGAGAGGGGYPEQPTSPRGMHTVPSMGRLHETRMSTNLLRRATHDVGGGANVEALLEEVGGRCRCWRCCWRCQDGPRRWACACIAAQLAAHGERWPRPPAADARACLRPSLPCSWRSCGGWSRSSSSTGRTSCSTSGT
jgi:hypothetical protein